MKHRFVSWWAVVIAMTCIGASCVVTERPLDEYDKDAEADRCSDTITYTITAWDHWPVQIRVDGVAGAPVPDSEHAMVQWIVDVESQEEALATVLHLCSHDRETGDVITCTEHPLDYFLGFEFLDATPDEVRFSIEHFNADGSLLENRIDGPCYSYFACGELIGAAC
jgi:hypothetical protein